MVSGTVDCGPFTSWECGTVADDKQPVEKAVELFVYAPVGVALYVRDMLPSMMGIFVSRGKREVQSHLPGRRRRLRHRRRFRPRSSGASTSRSASPTSWPRAASASHARSRGAASAWRPRRRGQRALAVPRTARQRRRRPSHARRLPDARGRSCVAPHRPRRRGAGRRPRRRRSDVAVVRRAPHPRLRRAVGVAGGRATRRPRPRVARRDPPLRDRAPRPQHHPGQDRAARLTWEASRPASADDIPRDRGARRAACAPSWRRCAGGALWLEREAWPEPLDDAYDALHRARRRTASSSAPSTTPSSASAPSLVEQLRSGARLGVVTDLFVEEPAREVGVGEAMVERAGGALPPRGVHRHRRQPRCPGHRASQELLRDPRVHRPRPHHAPTPRRREREQARGRGRGGVRARRRPAPPRAARAGPGRRGVVGARRPRRVGRDPARSRGPRDLRGDRARGRRRPLPRLGRAHPRRVPLRDPRLRGDRARPVHAARSRATTPPKRSWVPFGRRLRPPPRRRALRFLRDDISDESCPTRWTSTSLPTKRRSAPSSARSSTTSFPTWWKTVFVDDERAMPFTREFCHKLAARGWLTLSWPAEHGGADGSVWQQAVVREEMWAAGEPRGPQYMNLNYIGPLIMRFGTPGAAGAPPAAHGRRRRPVVPGVLRTRGRLRPRVAQDPRGARRRPLRRERPEDLEQLRRRARRPLPAARPHQHRGEEAGRHLDVPRRHAHARASPCVRSRAWRARASSARSSSTTPSSP